MKRILTTFTALLALCIPLRAQEPAKPAPAAPAAGTNLATTPVVHGGTEKRIEKFNEISKKGEAQLVFLGDSITDGWNGQKELWESAWGQYKPANFGIGGDRTEHVLYRLDHGNMDGLKPKLVVLMIGTNNTGHRSGRNAEPPQNTADGVKAIIDRIHKKSPETKVLLLAIFPRGEKPDDKLRVQNDAINAILAKMHDGKLVHYMDIGKSFLTPEGVLTAEVMADRLHPGAKGYQIWADAIKDKVAELMK
ncbi:MAG TPA: GDSL-type esterase/lipase family protein [Verrucomicrobiales bacterium]|nr:GDSL-type esterase/lipase family protein [Verrucomicrobiales bacterium]